MHQGRILFSQLLDYLPRHDFNRCVERYRGNHRVRRLSCFDQFIAMAFAQLTSRESLRDIEACLAAMRPKLYHAGIRGRVRRNTLAVANEKRDWRIWADMAMVLIAKARALYVNEDFGVELAQTAYAFDSTTISLCLAIFPWAKFRKAKAAVKLHTLLDLRGNIPSFIYITEGKLHDVNALDHLPLEPGSFYIMDRSYIDFRRLHRFLGCGAFFIVRAKRTLDFRRLASRPVDKTTGLRSDQTIVLRGVKSKKDYPDLLRRVAFYDAETKKRFVFLTNDFVLPALVIAQLYKRRWQIELFFKWIKQHLRIKVFFGTSENAVRTQVWIAVCVYVLVAIVRKTLNLDKSLYEILQVLSISLFENSPILRALLGSDDQIETTEDCNQLKLFES